MDKQLSVKRNNKPAKVTRARLNPRQNAFAYLYGSIKSPYFGKSPQAYIVAYNFPVDLSKYRSEWTAEEKRSYEVAKTNASRLLTNAHVYSKVIEFNRDGLTMEKVDFELQKLIYQDEDKHAKARGIEIFNDINGRIIKKAELSTKTQILGVIQHLYEEAEKPEEK